MSLTKVTQEMIDGFDSRTYAQLTTGTDPVYPGAYGPNPSKQGLQFWALNSAGDRKVFAGIIAETQVATAGAEAGRLHFLVNDGDFLQPIGTVDRDGSWILGPGSAAWVAQICGSQTMGGVPPAGAVFGERVSCADPDYDDCRVLAVRNTKIGDLTTLDYKVGMGFSILNTAGKERPTGHLRFQYSDRTANNECSYMYPTTLVNGVQIDGPYFHNNGIGFGLTSGALLDANTLGDYEQGTWTPVFSGDAGAIAGTWTVAPNGTYTRIGNLLFVSFYGYMAIPSGYPTGQVRVGGLPVVIKYGPAGRYQSITPSYTYLGAASVLAGYRWQAGGSDQALLYTETGFANWASGGIIELGGAGVFEIA